MLFLPYRIDSRKQGIPLITVLVCVVCIVVYWHQVSADTRYVESVEQFCFKDLNRRTIDLLRHVAHLQGGNPCYEVFTDLRQAEDSEARLRQMIDEAEPLGLFASPQDDYDYLYAEVGNAYQEFERVVPRHLTSDLAYDPRDLKIWPMITSSFTHGSIDHLIGNLLFFYIFAASVELVIGHLAFCLFVLGSSVATSLAYSYATLGLDDAMPSIGLSGVVMAAIAALGVMLPYARIRCFLWFLLLVRVFRIPAILLAFWYVGWDIFGVSQHGTQSGIDYVAHVSGAALGALLGVYFVFFKKRVVEEAAIHY